jgi:hypothetical protein
LGCGRDHPVRERVIADGPDERCADSQAGKVDGDIPARASWPDADDSSIADPRVQRIGARHNIDVGAAEHNHEVPGSAG